MPEPIVYIDRSTIHEGKLNEVRSTAHELAEFVERREPQLIAYGFYIDDEAAVMTVVAVHPDSASMKFHLEIADSRFRTFADLITLQGIEVYGRPSAKVLGQLQQKAEMLGAAGKVAVSERHAGFARLEAHTG